MRISDAGITDSTSRDDRTRVKAKTTIPDRKRRRRIQTNGSMSRLRKGVAYLAGEAVVAVEEAHSHTAHLRRAVVKATKADTLPMRYQSL